MTDLPNFQAEAEQIARNRKLAEALAQQYSGPGAFPAGQMVSGRFVQTSPFMHIAGALRGLGAQAQLGQLDQQQKALGARRNEALVGALSRMPRSRQEAVQSPYEAQPGSVDEMVTPSDAMTTSAKTIQPTMAENASWLGQLGQIGPDAVSMGGTLLGLQQKAEEGAENRAARLQERIMTLEAAAQNAALSREERAARALEAGNLRRELALDADRRMRELADQADRRARDLAAQASADRRLFAGMAAGNRAPVAIMTPDGPRYVQPAQAIGQQPANQNLSGMGKALPTSAAQKIMENQQNLRRAQQALAMIEGKTVGNQEGDPAATGWKGYLPESFLQRVDPSGVATRAAIADLGSLIIHDRSGAAVTAAEYPRLAPFIPRHTDDPATVKTKLQRFVTEYGNVVNEAVDFYKESGYRVPAETLRQSGADQTQTPGLPSQEAIDAELARRRGGR